MSRRVEVPGYRTAHMRVAAARGPASDHACVDCGGQASQWAYDHADDAELREAQRNGRTLAYSVNPEHYDPRCLTCHTRFDAPIRHVPEGPEIGEKCGTYAGWNEHKRGKTQPCHGCRSARTAYLREWRLRKASA